MQQDFLIESRSYDKMLRGTWRAYQLNANLPLGDTSGGEHLDNCIRCWLPAGTLMQWATGTRPLRHNCVQFFWPGRWYMLSAFYQDAKLIHTYANIIQPATIAIDRVSYTDLDLSLLFKPDLSYEVLTQAEFDHLAQTLHYDEETRVSALMALQTLTSTIQRSLGALAVVPHHLNLNNLRAVGCGN